MKIRQIKTISHGKTLISFLKRPKDVDRIQQFLALFPVTALLGPRQVGKTTLAKAFQPDHLFDLENPRDAITLENPQFSDPKQDCYLCYSYQPG